MNKILSLGFFGCLFFSTYAFSYCSGMDVCCSPETEVYCPYSTSSEKCTAGCDCCDLSTHEVVNSELNEDYYTCCKKEEEKVYWNGSSVQCCGGKVWKKDENSEACCHGDKTTNPTEKVVSVKYASITDLQTCCDIKTYGDSPTAYWNGSSAQCCKGQVYEPWEGSGEYDDWACCDGEVYDVSDYEKGCCESPGSVTDALGGEQACCESGYTGIYMDGWAECCPNENVAQYGRDSYECCTLEEEGYSLVKALGAPFDKKSCCYNSTEAVWNGSYVQCCSEGEVAAQADSGKAQCCPKDKPQLTNYEFSTDTSSVCCEKGQKAARYGSQYQSYGCCTDGREPVKAPSGETYCCYPGEKGFDGVTYDIKSYLNRESGCCPVSVDAEYITDEGRPVPITVKMKVMTGGTFDGTPVSRCCTEDSITRCCQPEKPYEVNGYCCNPGAEAARYASQHQSAGCCADWLTMKTAPSGETYCCYPDEDAFDSVTYDIKTYLNRESGCCPATDPTTGIAMKVITSGTFDGTPVSRCCTDKSTSAACCQPGDDYLYDYKDRSKLIGCCKPGTTPTYECCKDENGNCRDQPDCGTASCKVLQHRQNLRLPKGTASTISC